jgi:hypothetical protein
MRPFLKEFAVFSKKSDYFLKEFAESPIVLQGLCLSDLLSCRSLEQLGKMGEEELNSLGLTFQVRGWQQPAAWR